MFQSRNRESYLFKDRTGGHHLSQQGTFQSRNRESYLFKEEDLPLQKAVDEMKFQSRNRESYLFKQGHSVMLSQTDHLCFNLVIENLIFSSQGFRVRVLAHCR